MIDIRILIILISIASVVLVFVAMRRIVHNMAQLKRSSSVPGEDKIEKWDLFDQNRRPLRQTQNRQDDIRPGTYHVVVQIWTVNSRRELLLTLRHPDKPFGHYWECTGGSVLAGEDSRSGAVRELLEETGIRAMADELHLLGTVREASSFIDSYAVCKDIDITELSLQDGETVDAQWVTLTQLDQLLAEEKIAGPIKRRLRETRPALESFMQAHARQADLT